jgi:hypothetical protein
VSTSRKAFSFVKDHSENEGDCYLVGHLAALSGDTELFRKMIRAYFGEAEGELKGAYVEEFLQYNPDLFFSLPDTWDLWRAAGGGDWCCDAPDLTIPLISEHVGMSRDALRILRDVRDSVRQNAGTEWGRHAAHVLAAYSDDLR